MDEASREVLDQFNQLGAKTLDLHALLEAAGNDTEKRESIIDIVSRLVEDGYLEERGSDFYALTLKGQERLTK
jgi:DNA-binding PadR family transcriptional regulator